MRRESVSDAGHASELGGLVPKHRILAALITAGVNQAPTVRAGLRAELLDNLNA